VYKNYFTSVHFLLLLLFKAIIHELCVCVCVYIYSINAQIMDHVQCCVFAFPLVAKQLSQPLATNHV
jgi:hypothetical protein